MSLIETLKKESQEFSDTLDKERDEIKVQLHLLSMDAKNEWEELEEKYHHFKNKLSELSGIAEDSAKDVESALKAVGEEIKEGYRKIKNAL